MTIRSLLLPLAFSLAVIHYAAVGAETAEALIGRGVALDAEKNFAGARAEYEKALSADGVTPDQAGQALLYISAGHGRDYKWLPARQALDKALALEGVSDAIKIKAQMAIGDIARNYGDWANVKTAYAAALKFPGISVEQKIASQKAMAAALVNMRQYAEARAVMKEMVANESLPPADRAATQVSVGKSLMLERDFPAARTEFAKALAMPGVTDALKAESQLQIGLSYYEAQDYERAKPELMKVLEMPGAGVRAAWDGGRIAYLPSREAMLRLRLRNLVPDVPKTLKVLFIGSSHTFRNDIPELVRQLVASAPTNQPRILVGDYLRMGTALNTFWDAGDTPDTARGVIAAEPWDAVVFETFYNMKQDVILKYETLMVDLIRSKNAKPIVYESPIAKASAYPDAFQKFHDDNLAVAKALKVPVAPSVRAWMNYLGPKPTEQQFGVVYADWIHASPKGAYMAACCIYAALTGASPVGLYHPADIAVDEAKVLQEAAWKAYQESNADMAPSAKGS